MRGPGQSSVVAQFLGAEAASGGLHALLGVATTGLSEEEVITALERRLERIDGHPQGRTPEADEVRLALHAAAAQLLSQSAARRRALGGRPASQAPLSMARQKSHLLERDALLTLARYGGWNRRSLRRLTMLAMARGARPAEIAGVLQHLAGRRRPGRATEAQGHRRQAKRLAAAPSFEPVRTAIPQPEPEDETAGRPVAILIGAVATGLTLVVAVALIFIAISSGRGPGAEPAEPAAPERTPLRPDELPMAGGEELFPWQGQQPGSEVEAPAEETSRPRFDRLSDALAALDSAVDGLAIDPEQAVRVFDGAFAGVGAQWCTLTLSQQRAAQHDVVEFVYRAVQRPDLVEPVVEAIARDGSVIGSGEIDATSVWPAAWSAGMLARLAHERDIGAVAAREIETRLRSQAGSAIAVSGGFSQGAHAALWAMLPAMVHEGDSAADAEDRWERWIAAVRFGDRDGQAALLAALEWSLTAPAEPTENDRVRTAIESLALACDWNDGSPGRAWLIRMFQDDRVSIADLHALTTTLARRSRAPGVDVTMALPVRANADARESLREQYAAVWAIELHGPTLDDLAEDWMDAARQAARDARDDESVVARLATAVTLSRLSEAATLRHAGLLDQAGIVIDEYDRPVEIELTAWNNRARSDRVDDDPGMSEWALRYLSAQRDFPRRLELLAAVADRHITHPADAEVLVTEAVRGSPAQARGAARSALLAQKPTAVLTLAMLEIAPRMPRTRQNAELVAALTATPSLSTDDPNWRLRTRRILVQTALEQLAAEGDDGVIDRLAALLGGSYMARVTAAPGGSAGAAMPEFPPHQAAGVLRMSWERGARQGGLGSGVLEVDQVLARHASRVGLAQGPVQTFAAEQLTAFELMCLAVAAERLDRAGAVQDLRARARAQRTEAADIVEQIVVVERAFLELWAIRLGQESPWD